ncbi:MAG: hypothetical protein LQ338_004027 [Usnochroma carphineum]|nr:MAG: hypothetical protein LQ338_004027 [Usnochroma carphineum]
MKDNNHTLNPQHLSARPTCVRHPSRKILPRLIREEFSTQRHPEGAQQEEPGLNLQRIALRVPGAAGLMIATLMVYEDQDDGMGDVEQPAVEEVDWIDSINECQRDFTNEINAPGRHWSPVTGGEATQSGEESSPLTYRDMSLSTVAETSPKKSSESPSTDVRLMPIPDPRAPAHNDTQRSANRDTGLLKQSAGPSKKKRRPLEADFDTNREAFRAESTKEKIEELATIAINRAFRKRGRPSKKVAWVKNGRLRDSVAQILATRAISDPSLLLLVERVAFGNSSQCHVYRLQQCIDDELVAPEDRY